MTAQLGHLCGAKVGIVSPHSAMHFKHSTLGARGIGEALRADYLLEGSTRCEGDRARITARLVRTSDETQMWSETYDRRLEDCLGVQADVAARIARSLTMELVPPQQSPTVSPVRGAYEAFLKGRYYWRKTADTGVLEALNYYEEALRLDPSFAAALAGISRVQVLRGECYHEVPRRAFEKARAAAEHAIALGGDVIDAHLSSADIARYLDQDLTRARAGYKRAIALNPSSEGARIGFAKMLAALGEFPAAIREADEAANELDPVVPHGERHVGLGAVSGRRLRKRHLPLPRHARDGRELCVRATAARLGPSGQRQGRGGRADVRACGRGRTGQSAGAGLPGPRARGVWQSRHGDRPAGPPSGSRARPLRVALLRRHDLRRIG
jgi:hypothetical protein